MFRMVLNDLAIKALWDVFSFTKHTFPQKHFNSNDVEKTRYYIDLDDKEIKPNKIKYQDGFTLVFDTYSDKGQTKLWLPDLKNGYAEGNHLYGSGRDMQPLTLNLDVYAYGTLLELLNLAKSEGFGYVDMEFSDGILVIKWDTVTSRIKGCTPVEMLVPTTKKKPYVPMKYHMHHTKQRGCTHVMSKEKGIFATNTGTCLKVTKNVPVSDYDFSNLSLGSTTEERYESLVGWFMDKVDKTKSLPEVDVNRLINKCPKMKKVEYFDQKIKMYVEGSEVPFPFAYQDKETGAYGFGYISVLVDEDGTFIRELTRWVEATELVILGFLQMDMLETINKFDYKNKASGEKIKAKDLYEFGIADLGHRFKTAFVILDKDNLILSPLCATHQVNGEPEYWYKTILDIMPHTLV